MKLLLTCLLLVTAAVGYTQTPEMTTITRQLDSIAEVREQLLADMEVLKLNWIQEELVAIGLPNNGQSETIISHYAYKLSYNETHEQANWVMHMILPDIERGNHSRSNDFREDPLIETGSTQEKDYFLKELKADSTYKYDGFGYDRGHLAPSADFRWSKKALSESYFYSNMSPQLGDFNREKWAELENWLREYVLQNKVPIYVVTAPVLTDDLKKVERSVNGLSIPEYFVKVAFDRENNRGIGFVLPHEKIELPLESYAVSIDSVERLLGYDLFSGLEDDIENAEENKVDYAHWLPEGQKGDVTAIPLKKLPKRVLNTYGVHVFIDDGKKHTVCGQVVSTKKHHKGHVFIDVDKKFPNQVFTVSIFESNVPNFDYEPEVYLKDKQVCFTGEITDYKGVTNMVIENGKQVKLLGDY